jgi:hypothetical protein
MKGIKMPKVKKQKYYAIHSKHDNFLHGVFPLTKEGYKSAQEYISKLSSKGKTYYYIEKK